MSIRFCQSTRFYKSVRFIMCPSDLAKYDLVAKLIYLTYQLMYMTYLQNLVDFQNLMEFQNLMDFPLWNGSVAHLLDYYRKSIRFCNKHELVERGYSLKRSFSMSIRYYKTIRFCQSTRFYKSVRFITCPLSIRFCKIWFSCKIYIPDIPEKSGGL